MPSHPSWYRPTQKWETSTAHNYNNEFGVVTLAQAVGDTFRSGNGLQQACQGNRNKNSYYSPSPLLQATDKSVDQSYETQSQETSLKIKELKRLLNKHDFPHADIVLEWAILSGKADQNYLNEKLAQLRKIDIPRS